MRSAFEIAAVLVCVVTCTDLTTARAAVTPAAAEQLKTVLTPTGAERAANRDGTIPAWTGGYVTAVPGYQQGQVRPDPYSADRPLFTITNANLKDYADRLPDGARALFQRFADYRMAVYL